MSPAQTLLDDVALLQEGAAPRDALHRWRAAGPDRPASLVVSDQQLIALDRLASQDDPVPVTVVNSTGAGGLVSLSQRSLPRLKVHAVRSPIRDLDDLTGNARRIVSAAAELDEKIEVYVEMPDAWGWERAAGVVEAAGLFAGLTTTGPADPTLTARMSALVELDLGFAVDARVLAPSSLPGLLAAVEALIEDATPQEAAAALMGVSPDLSGWDALRRARVARRLRRVLTTDVAQAAAALAAAGLSEP